MGLDRDEADNLVLGYGVWWIGLVQLHFVIDCVIKSRLCGGWT